MTRYIAFLLLIFFPHIVFAFSYTIELTKQQLQEKVEKKMPIKKSGFLVTVTLSNPKITLINGNDRIGIESNIDIILPGGAVGKGRGHIDGKIKYVAEKGEFYFVNPEVTSISVQKIDRKYQNTIKKFANIAVKNALKRIPVYRLKDNNLKQKMAKAVLKNVVVGNGKLILELGI